MPPTGTASAVIASTPDAVLAAVHQVIESKGFTPGEESTATSASFVTRKTGLNWELDGVAAIAAVDGGTELTVTLSSRPDRPKALLDGRKNKKAAQKLLDEITAAV